MGLFGCVYVRGTCGYRQRNMGGGSSRVFFFSQCVRADCGCADVFSYVLWGGLGLQRTHVSTHALLRRREGKLKGCQVQGGSRIQTGRLFIFVHFSFFIPDKQLQFNHLLVPSRSVSEATGIGVCDLIYCNCVRWWWEMTELLVMIQTFIHTVPTRNVR